ncbi:MAG: type II toxin-antitoxin system prevent-host-death family antitoxin [Deltaproteobacteria bacterium]|nr:type II toxin-antitoxin system prevent-host-death family antitoxin [Deltaproteobacteria bacterium]
MVKTTATRLKAKLGQYMRAVKSGQQVLITDRDQPVAKLVPFKNDHAKVSQLEFFKSHDPIAAPLGQINVQSIKYCGPSTTDLLSEDRARR